MNKVKFIISIVAFLILLLLNIESSIAKSGIESIPEGYYSGEVSNFTNDQLTGVLHLVVANKTITGILRLEDIETMLGSSSVIETTKLKSKIGRFSYEKSKESLIFRGRTAGGDKLIGSISKIDNDADLSFYKGLYIPTDLGQCGNVLANIANDGYAFLRLVGERDNGKNLLIFVVGVLDQDGNFEVLSKELIKSYQDIKLTFDYVNLNAKFLSIDIKTNDNDTVTFDLFKSNKNKCNRS